MAEEEAVAPLPSDHKRKLEDLEPEAPQPPTCPIPVELEAHAQETALMVEPSTSPDVKRPRLEDPSVAMENGYEDKNADEFSYGNKEQENGENGRAQDAETHLKDGKNASDDQKPAVVEKNDLGESEPSPVKNFQMNKIEEPSKEEGDPNTHNVSQPGDASMQQLQETFTESATISRKIEVPNDKVGVLIGKGGDTVRFLQYNSGAKIQIVRDADADMACLMRPVELIGSLESITKAEKLIRDVMTEADAGGSPSLIARGFATGQTAGDAEQFEMKVPNEKVGLIIGRGGDTIKGLQTRSGARIQLIPQQAGEGHESERTIRVTGHKRQIDIAVEMIKDVMKQLPKPSHLSGSYRQQAYQSHGGPPAQWGPPHVSSYPSQPMMGHDYRQQRGGPYASQNPQYPPSYNAQAPPQVAPRQSGFGFGWDQRPPPHDGNNNNFYGGHGPNAQALGPHAGAPVHGHGPGIPPPPQANYNYGSSTQGPSPEYGHSGPYSSQAAPTHQGYGHLGYEAKYECAPPPHSHGSSQPAYSQSAPQSGYYMQQQYVRPPTAASYGMNTHHPHSYGNPRGNQPGGDAMTTYNLGSNQLYGSQQQVYSSSYPAASALPPMQQQQTTYPVYSTDGQGQGGAAAYGSYPSMQQAAGYPTTEQQATTYHHQAAPAASHPQDPSSAAAVSYTPQQQQQAAGFTQQPPTAQSTYPQYDSAAQHVYGGPPAAC